MELIKSCGKRLHMDCRESF